MSYRALVFWLALLCETAGAATTYVGSSVCTGCHKEIAASHAHTNMASTWQDAATRLLPPSFRGEVREGAAPGVLYSIRRDAKGFSYRVEAPGRALLEAPVEVIMGGTRHGLSFLARVKDLDGLPLIRPTLVETRYLQGLPHGGLELSPGFPAGPQSTYESLLGRALTPEFETKCLNCHGAPRVETGKQAGVQCESCHGPGRPHLEAVAAGHPRDGISRGKESCTACHNGFSPITDPIPEDLLISSQVNALAHSECSLQSAGAITCTQCHAPHRDSPDTAARSVQTCAGCHTVEAAAKVRCLECHMPVEQRGPFHMVDHWIRVHPEQTSRSPHTVSPHSKFPPLHEHLRTLVVDNRAKAEALRARLDQGEAFFDLARDNSLDPSAPGGGYLGDLRLDQLSAPLRAAAEGLRPGGVSGVVENGGKFMLLGRLPRDFRWRANQVLEEASRLKEQGKAAEAIQKYVEALQIYPHFLRALIFLGSTVGEQGNAARAIGVLEFAAQLYPEDAAAQYNLGIAYDATGHGAEAVAAYRRAIAAEPSLTPAYQNLGADLLSAGQVEQAAVVFREGLRENPLSAILYYNLAQVMEQQHDTDGAKWALALARKIDPLVGTKAGL